MKRLAYFLISFTLLVSCQSKVDKANKLIKEQFFKTLYDFQSYQPIETIIDSAYTSIYDDKNILNTYNHIVLYIDSINKCREKIEEYRVAAEASKIYSGSWYATKKMQLEYLNDYNKYTNLFDEYTNMSEYYKLKSDELLKSLKKDVENFQNEFEGWQAKHIFRCKSKSGDSQIANYIFVFNKEMSKIIRYDNIEGKDYYNLRKGINSFIFQ